jgi:hypothetical protein
MWDQGAGYHANVCSYSAGSKMLIKLAWLSHLEFCKHELTVLITIELDSTTLREFSQTVDGIIVLYQNNCAV